MDIIVCFDYEFRWQVLYGAIADQKIWSEQFLEQRKIQILLRSSVNNRAQHIAEVQSKGLMTKMTHDLSWQTFLGWTDLYII